MSLQDTLATEIRETFADELGLTPQAVEVIETAHAYTASRQEAAMLRDHIAAHEEQLNVMRARLVLVDEQTTAARDAFLALIATGGGTDDA